MCESLHNKLLSVQSALKVCVWLSIVFFSYQFPSRPNNNNLADRAYTYQRIISVGETRLINSQTYYSIVYDEKCFNAFSIYTAHAQGTPWFLVSFPIVPMYSLIRLFLFLSSYFLEIFLQRRLTVLKLSIKLRHPCFFQVYCNRKPRIRRAVDSDPQYQVQMYFRLIK